MQKQGDRNKHLFFWDTETTGLFKYGQPPAILDLAIVDGKTGESKQWLINPRGVKIQKTAQDVHHISMEMVSDCEDLGEIAGDLFAWVRNRCVGEIPVLCGYNSQAFDNRVLMADLARYDIELPHDWLFADLFLHVNARSTRQHPDVICAEELDSLPNRKLVTLYQALVGKPLDGAHRALADASALCEVWAKISLLCPKFVMTTITTVEARGPRWSELKIHRPSSDTPATPSVKEPDTKTAHTETAPPTSLSDRPPAAVRDRAIDDESPAVNLRGVGPKMSAALEADGVRTVGDLRSRFSPLLATPTELTAAVRRYVREGLKVKLGDEYLAAIAAQLQAAPAPTAAQAEGPAAARAQQQALAERRPPVGDGRPAAAAGARPWSRAAPVRA